ncbi:hypothetical protein MCN98_07965 [Flavobacteriaceae bacterium LSUCC0859]|nr:hypothetical protein [Flavobacteriaceae bacterium LSUCC0859]
MKIKKVLYFLIYLFLLASIFINYQVFSSHVIQNKILSDLKNPSGMQLKFDTINALLPSIPNVTITAMPLDVYRVNYLLNEGRLSETDNFISKAIEINPHVRIGDYLKAKVLIYQNEFTDALPFAKSAFEGWPKNLDHYNTYLDVLEKVRDTTSLINAYNYLPSKLKANTNYFQRFYESFNKVKLSFLVTEYEDQRSISPKELTGHWERVYNFPKQIIRDTTLHYIFKSKNLVESNSGDEYLFTITKDTFNFFFKSKPSKPILSFPVFYSDSLETLIFRNVPLEGGKFQDQFYRRKAH